MSYIKRIQLSNKIVKTLVDSVQDIHEIHDVVESLLKKKGSLNKIRDEFNPEEKTALFEEWQVLSTNQYRFRDSLYQLIDSANTFNQSLKEDSEFLYYFQIKRIEKEKDELAEYIRHMTLFMEETTSLVEEATKFEKD